MRKRNYVYVWISVMLLGITGCATEPSKVNEIPTVTIESKKNTEIPTPTPIPTSISTPTPTSMPKPSSVLFSAKDFNSFNRMLSMDVGLQLFGKSLFCVDDQTGVTYFVNQGKDYYLYQIKDGEVELVVSMPVKELYPYQGSIYFMIDSYNTYELKDMHSGDIYCYTPESGTVELIYAAGAMEGSKNHRLTVEESGIYFCYEVEKEIEPTVCFYQLPFGETEPVQDKKYMTMKGWKEYHLFLNPNLILQSRIAGEDGTREIIELPSSEIRFCIAGDMFYSAERTYISCINLETGEKTGYDFLEAIKEVQGQDMIDDYGFRIIESFVITEEAVWITTGSYLYSMDLQSGEVSYAQMMDGKNRFYVLTTLYTDGKEVYGLDSYAKENISVVRVLTNQIEEQELGIPVMRVESLTE